ncbi:uncharacterized protein LOC141616858 [Silene latifolia]|uniref:uncharacterized protein LOC141616858 n=1 Tax=Silene latifolia TaxID=37657 RepID=UPI003D786BDA
MVGYEPELNPPVDGVKELRELLGTDEPETSNASLSTPLIKPSPESVVAVEAMPLIKPCQTQHEVEATPEAKATYDASLTTPLVQVFSVCISADFDDGKPCEIYGSIRALEESHPRFYLYNRDPEDSETIWKKGTLSLIGPDGGAIIPSLGTELKLCLYDRIRGVDVVKGTLNLDSLSDDSYDRLIKCDVEGPNGSASVYYVVFQFAIYASLQVIITKYDNDDKKCNATDIYGSVVVGYENGRMYCSGDEDVKQLETRLFEKPSHQPMRVMVGTPIRLARNTVAVPPYSTLNIKVNLWDSSDGQIASDFLQVPVYRCGDRFLFIWTQYACVEVRIRWHNAYVYIYRDIKILASNRAESSKAREEMLKKPRVSHDQQRSSSLKSKESYRGEPKVEVFTVFIGGITDKISALCGTILVDDGGDRFSIYKRDESCSELLQDNGLACIEFNYRAIQNDEFAIILKLNDPVGNFQVSRGDLGYNVGNVRLWYNKRLCSVVRGKDGFAAVHYAIFHDAIQAFVEIKVFANGHPDIPISLHGMLIARYSGHDYSTSYQKKYYISRLFDRPQDKPLQLKSGSSIELLKSIVVVPIKSFLIIEADLKAFGTNNVDESICGTQEFKFDLTGVSTSVIHGEELPGTMTKVIRGGGYWIEVSAKFQK